MSDTQNSTIAQLLFADKVPLNLARLVADMEMIAARISPTKHHLTWDCDDIAIFDFPGTRIVLGWSESIRPGFAACLTLSVGPSHVPPTNGGPDIGHHALSSRLVERVSADCHPDAVLWRQVTGIVTSDYVDTLLDEMADLPNLLEPEYPAAPSPDTAFALVTASPALAANDAPDIPRPCDPELARLRAALYPAPEYLPVATPQLRLSAYAMNATLIVVWAPLGGAVMTYSLLKGEDMKFSARLMVATGVALGLLNTEFGQTMAAMAGI
jgi:hypothetical protein